MDWSQYPNFTKEEFDCKHTGRNEMQPSFMKRLQKLRTLFGRPMIITSGYRDPSHPVEARKDTPGVHTLGLAADIAVDREEAYRLLMLSFRVGFTGIGLQQKGTSRFIHLDCNTPPRFPRPTIWSY